VIYPAYYEIVIPNQATFKQTFQLKNDSGAPINLTSYQLRASMWTEDKRAKLADFALTWVDRTIGKFDLSLSEAVTTTMDRDGMWDLLVVNPDSTEDYWLRGPAVIAKGYTK
jgi:hypothetical protein